MSGVDIFSREDFENALPCIKNSKNRAWIPLGLFQGEYCYLLPLPNGTAVHIRSSIGASGISAGCGENSIRAWIVDIEVAQYPSWVKISAAQLIARLVAGTFNVKSAAYVNGDIFTLVLDNDENFKLHQAVIGGKINKYTKRTPGWKERMDGILRRLAKMAMKIRICPNCNKEKLGVYKVKKEGPNHGRFFLSCATKGCHFEWLEEETSPQESK